MILSQTLPYLAYQPNIAGRNFSTFAMQYYARFDDWSVPSVSTDKIPDPAEGAGATDAIELRVWTFGRITLTRHSNPVGMRGADGDAILPAAFSNDPSCVVLARGPEVAAGHLTCRSVVSDGPLSPMRQVMLALHLPFQILHEHGCAIDELFPASADEAVVRSAMASVLSDYLASLARHLPTLPSHRVCELEAATAALVSACLRPSVQMLVRAEKPLAAALVERARRIVRQNIGRPEFGPDELCRHLSVSRSRLYRIFERHGGVAQFIQQERLAEAHRRLADAADATPISALAIDLGFLDHSTFSRAFKREYGYSPSQARELGLVVRLSSGDF